MSIKELLEWYQTVEDRNLPRYLEMEEIGKDQIRISGRLEKCINAWGILKEPDGWQYVQTDKNTGKIVKKRKFGNQVLAAAYAKDILTKQLARDDPKNKAVEYAKKKLGYSFDGAAEQVDRLFLDGDAFREFVRYMKSGNFADDDGSQIEACGYTAYDLCTEFNMGPLEACVCMAALRKNARTKEEFLEWIASVPQKDLPKYSEINEIQAAAGSGWQGERYVWGIVCVRDEWIYLETDRKGFISDRKEFPRESSAVSYARRVMESKIREARHTTPYDKAVKFIQEELGCSGEMAVRLADQIYACPDMADEFLQYIDTGSFGKGKEVLGYTAAVLRRKYGLNPVDAFVYMAQLQKNHDYFESDEPSLPEQAEILERRMEDNEAMMKGIEKSIKKLEMQMRNSAKKETIADEKLSIGVQLVQSDRNGCVTWDYREMGSITDRRLYGKCKKEAKEMQRMSRRYGRLEEKRKKLEAEKEELKGEHRKALIKLNMERNQPCQSVGS